MLHCLTMNAKRVFLIAATMAALSARAADERVNASALPPAVQKTLETWRSQGPVKQIVRRTVDGRTVYDVEIEKNNAPNPRVRIAEDGTLMRNPAASVSITGDGIPIVTDEYGSGATPLYPKLKLADLPAAVQETARRESKGREIADIDHETWNGRSVYEVEFAQRGVNTRVYVADDGTLIRDERPRRSVKSLFMGTQLEDLPTAVQETIRRVAGDREIADIDKKGTGQEPIYRVEIKDTQGTQELRIAQDGKVIYDSRAPKPARG